MGKLQLHREKRLLSTYRITNLPLPPGQSLISPTTLVPTLSLFIRVALKTFKNVVRLVPELGSAFGRCNRTHTTSAQEQHFLPRWHSQPKVFLKSRVDGHTRPLLPGQRNGARYKADPFALGIGPHINQHSCTSLPPFKSKLRRHVAGVPFSRAYQRRVGHR